MAGTKSHCVSLETNLDTRVDIVLHNGESIPDFKERLCKKHLKNFPEIGKISISAFKVELRGQFYHISDDDFLIFAKACEHIFYVDALSVEKPKTKEKTQKQKQKMKERKRKQKLKRDKPVKNKDATPLDMGTMNTNCGEVHAGVAIEKEKKRKRSSTKHISQSSNRYKILRTLSKDQADATESKDITSNGLEACIYNPLDLNMNGMEAAYPSTDGVSAPTIVELNSAALEEAPPLENANEAPKKSGSSLLKKRTEVCDLAGNTLVLVGTIGNGLVECLLDHSNKQHEEEQLETETAVVTSDVKNQDATPLDMGTVNTNCGEVQVGVALEKEKKRDKPWNDVSLPRNEEEKHETETAVVTSDVKNQDATRLDLGTVNTTCGEVQVGVAIEKEKKMFPTKTVLATDQSSNRSKISRTLSKDQADATESRDSPSDGVVACINNPLDVNMNNMEAAPTTVEGNSAALEEAPPIENTIETDALLTPAKNDIELIEISDNSEDDSISKQIPKEKSDIVGGGKKQDQVTGRAKSVEDSSSDSSSDYVLISTGNNLAGGTNIFLGSLQDILRASQSHDDMLSDAESPVPKKI